MPRAARIVAIGHPHHITQRGNNREPVFFDDQDRRVYLEFLQRYSIRFQIDIWAYCLMPNHVHLLAVPHREESFARGLGMVHLDYTRYINRKHMRSGRIWQNRFFSCAILTECHLWAVTRYIEMNPVKACLTTQAENYRWSSARHHLHGEPDTLIEPTSWLNCTQRDEYRKFIQDSDPAGEDRLRLATRRGQPLL